MVVSFLRCIIFFRYIMCSYLCISSPSYSCSLFNVILFVPSQTGWWMRADHIFWAVDQYTRHGVPSCMCILFFPVWKNIWLGVFVGCTIHTFFFKIKLVLPFRLLNAHWSLLVHTGSLWSYPILTNRQMVHNKDGDLGRFVRFVHVTETQNKLKLLWHSLQRGNSISSDIYVIQE